MTLLCIPYTSYLKWLSLILTNFCLSYWDTDTGTDLHFRISHPLPTSGNFKISRTTPKQDHTLIYSEILVFFVLINSTTKIFHVFLTDMLYTTYILISILKMSRTYQCFLSFSKPISEFLLTLSCVAVNYYVCCTR